MFRSTVEKVVENSGVTAQKKEECGPLAFVEYRPPTVEFHDIDDTSLRLVTLGRCMASYGATMPEAHAQDAHDFKSRKATIRVNLRVMDNLIGVVNATFEKIGVRGSADPEEQAVNLNLLKKFLIKLEADSRTHPARRPGYSDLSAEDQLKAMIHYEKICPKINLDCHTSLIVLAAYSAMNEFRRRKSLEPTYACGK